MRLTVTGVCLALLLQAMSALPLQQPLTAKGSIEGVVTRAGTGDPIPGARVTLQRVGAAVPAGLPPPPPPPPPPARIVNQQLYTQINSSIATESLRINSSGGAPSVLTDSQGRFVLKDVDSGTYRVSVGANGYAKQEYGQRTAAGQGIPINVNSVQVVKEIAISLTPAGNISGRIRDGSGQPAAGIQVQLVKAVYNSIGAKNFQASGTARTDDRGEYRLFWITPGRYLVLAGSAIPGILGSGIGSPNEVVGDAVPTTFYPGVTELDQAAPVDLKPGADIGGVDIIVNRKSAFRVRGRLIDSRSGQVPASASITLITPSLTGTNFSSNSSQSYNGQDGTFELREVSPGPHIVRAQLAVGSNTVTPENAGAISAAGQVVSGQIALNVLGDMDGVALTLSASVSIPGRVTLEGPAVSGPQGANGLPALRVQLSPSIDGLLASPIGGPVPRSQPTNSEGVFRVDTLITGEYRISVAPLPPDVYVKQARFNQNDVLNKPMQFSTSDTGTLEVLLSSRGGQIDGIVNDERQRGVPNIQAVLIPDRQRDRSDLYKTATTDASGHFSLRGIAPGDYRLFAWEAIDPYAYFDPDLVKQFESKGKPVHITESAKESVDVRMIPAEP